MISRNLVLEAFQRLRRHLNRRLVKPKPGRELRQRDPVGAGGSAVRFDVAPCLLDVGLTSPALYHVSVRDLAALAWTHPGGAEQTRRLRTRSQASFPPPVTRTQLPSSRTSPRRAIIWYNDLRLKVPKLVQGTCTPQQSRPCRAHNATEPVVGSILKS